MSIKVIQWVWDCSKSRNAERLVLLAIADNAADDGTRAYPSISEIGRKAALSERGVQNAIARLVKLGELVVVPGGGRRHTNSYQVIMTPCPKTPQNLPPSTPGNPAECDVETPQNEAETPQNATVNPAESAPEPSRTVHEPSLEPLAPSSSTRGTRLPDDWEPSDKIIEWCRQELVPGARWSEASRRFVRVEHEKFVDYWRAQPGAKGRKADWPATWRNWMRRAFERFDASRPLSPAAPKPFVQQADEYKATKQAANKAALDLAQILIDRGMSGTDAVNRARAIVAERVAAGEPIETSSAMPYIEGVILDEEPKEVTGS